ncbi:MULTISPECIES: hypothetical protein [Phyllobacteriaceae]|nr:hypothetical protein [Chelativorans sp. M5D2P16]MDZ5695949.1 hypothetical protein [Chelativorans sp. M5D2P16]
MTRNVIVAAIVVAVVVVALFFFLWPEGIENPDEMPPHATTD